MEAVEGWFRERLGLGWYEMNVDHGIGTPFVHVRLDFRSPLTPRDNLASTVRQVRLGGSSLRFAVAGRVGERLAYEAELVCAFVDTAAMKPIRAPERFRPALEAEAEIAAA
jgi:4-hydroxybenzoyl-CoA thioesterase